MKKIILFLAVLFTASMASAQKHELSIGYGYPTSSQLNHTLANAFSLLGIDESFSGSFNLEYMYKLNPKMAVGMIVGYEQASDDAFDYSEKFINIMPAFRMTWVEKKIFRFYSKVALGITIDNAEVGNQDDSDVEFAYQIAPLGFEVGRCFAGFAELGYGCQGIAQIGLRYKF
ncbi:MAG: outer membrane beta-barrel protein [Bacteroidales bacterium]